MDHADLALAKGSLPYDLDQLYNYTRKAAIQRVVLYFPDAESMEGRLLIELIEVLR